MAGALQTGTWELGPGQDEKERGEEIEYGVPVGGTDVDTVGRESPRGGLQERIEGLLKKLFSDSCPHFAPVKGSRLPISSMEVFLKKSGGA